MDEELCALTGRRCHQTRFGGERCAPEPSIEQAASCIGSLDERSIELANEVAAQDRWIERLKAQIAELKPPKGGH
jgi:hypothetical protein